MGKATKLFKRNPDDKRSLRTVALFAREDARRIADEASKLSWPNDSQLDYPGKYDTDLSELESYFGALSDRGSAIGETGLYPDAFVQQVQSITNSLNVHSQATLAKDDWPSVESSRRDAIWILLASPADGEVRRSQRNAVEAAAKSHPRGIEFYFSKMVERRFDEQVPAIRTTAKASIAACERFLHGGS